MVVENENLAISSALSLARNYECTIYAVLLASNSLEK